MNKKRMIEYIIAFCVIAALAVGTVVASGVGGSADDPVITKSYVDKVVMPKVENYVNAKAADFASGNGETASPASFSVVNMSKGQRVIAAAGTEIILRMGSADIIATAKGGLADTTSGTDLSDGTDMPSNHLLIVPVADGRGVEAKSEVILMIKGGYTLQ